RPTTCSVGRRRRPQQPRPRRGRSALSLPARQAPALARDAQGSVRESLEARLGNGLAALLAVAVGAVADLDEGSVDLLDGGLGLGAQRQVALALDVHR